MPTRRLSQCLGGGDGLRHRTSLASAVLTWQSPPFRSPWPTSVQPAETSVVCPSACSHLSLCSPAWQGPGFLEDTHWAPSLSPLQGPASQPFSQHRKGTGGWTVEMAQLEAMALQNKVIWKVTDAVSFIWASQSYVDIQILSYLAGFPSGSKVIVF